MSIDWRGAVQRQAGVSRWEVGLAHVIPWLLLPSGIWRLALGFGIPVGFTGELAELYAAPGWITPYVIMLTIVTEAAALTAFAFVQRWGVVVPDGLPFGGRRAPVWLVAGAGALEVFIVASLTWTMVTNWDGPENMGDPDAPQGVARIIMTLGYLPAVAWAPLLAVLVVAFVVRRTRTGAPSQDTAPVKAVVP